MKRQLARSDKWWLNVGSWVWLLVFGALGVGVLLYKPHGSRSETNTLASIDSGRQFPSDEPRRSAAGDQGASDPAQAVPTSLQPAHYAEHDGYALRNIEDLQVGDRVLAHNPEVAEAERANWEEPDWSQWMKLSLAMPKPDGSTLTIEMLRSESWVIAQTRFVVDAPRVNYVEAPADDYADEPGVAAHVPWRPIYYHLRTRLARIAELDLRLVALTIEMDLPELGLTGDAILVDIEPSPPVNAGSGSVVTATFHHSSGDVIDLVVADQANDRETIGTTSNHPFWSVDREAYVQASTLELGERVLTYSGDTKRIASKLARPGPEAVFNLEVYGEHVYFVGQDGLLVHNSGSTYAISSSVPGVKVPARVRSRALRAHDRAGELLDDLSAGYDTVAVARLRHKDGSLVTAVATNKTTQGSLKLKQREFFIDGIEGHAEATLFKWLKKNPDYSLEVAAASRNICRKCGGTIQRGGAQIGNFKFGRAGNRKKTTDFRIFFGS